MKNNLYPCLWFDGNAKAAAEFYCSVFSHSKLISENSIVVRFEIEGQLIMGLNGGPMFKINPSISLLVTCENEKEIDSIWDKLIDGGSALMPINEYPWSKKYGWVKDKFGMTWQLMLGDLQQGRQKIIPNFIFVGSKYGKAQESIQHYTSIFPNSKIHDLQIYQEEDSQTVGNLKFGYFNLQDQFFSVMDVFGDHEFEFNEGFSLVVECETQEEIDNYWNRLTEGGIESQCGWLKDKFGVSWQIVPTILGKLMSDPEKYPRVMQAFLKMKKMDIVKLINV